jgi:hypothetical protein
VKHKNKKAKVPPEEIVARMMANPLYLGVMNVLIAATDEELAAYAKASSAVLGVLVTWAKKAAFGFASTDDLRKWFFTDATPKKVQNFFERVIALLANAGEPETEEIAKTLTEETRDGKDIPDPG